MDFEEETTSNEIEEDHDERFYIQLPPNSVQILAEGAGYPHLGDNILLELTKSANFNITEVMQCAKQFMVHSLRQKLTVEDVDRALFWCNVPPTYSQRSSTTVAYSRPDKKKEHFMIEDKEIDLLDLIGKNKNYEVETISSCKSLWFAFEGLPVTNNKQPDLDLNEMFSSLSEDQKNYCSLIMNAILEDEGIKLQIVLKDLSSNPKLGSLMPHLVAFIYNKVHNTSNYKQLSKLIMTIGSLVNNDSLYFGHELYLKCLIDSLFQSMVLCHKNYQSYEDSFCIQKKGNKVCNQTFNVSSTDKWSLLELTIEVMSQVLKELHPSNTCQNLLQRLTETISRTDKSLSSVFGATAVIIALGPSAINNMLYPHMADIIRYMTENVPISVHEQEEAQKLHHLLLRASKILLVHAFNQTGCKDEFMPHDVYANGASQPQVSLTTVYKKISDFFGDAFTPHLFCIELDVKSVPPDTVLFSPSEQGQRGTKILEEFYVSPFKVTQTSKLKFIFKSVDLTKGKSTESQTKDLGRKQKNHCQRFDKDNSEHSDDFYYNRKKFSIGKRQFSSKVNFKRKLLSGNLNTFL